MRKIAKPSSVIGRLSANHGQRQRFRECHRRNHLLSALINGKCSVHLDELKRNTGLHVDRRFLSPWSLTDVRRVQRDKDRKRVYVGHRLKAFWMFIQGSKIISLADVATRYSVLRQPRPACITLLNGSEVR